VLWAAILAGCVKVATVDGFTFREEAGAEMLNELRTRASFDMGCPAQELRLTVLSVDYPERPRYASPRSVGVTGCDKQLTYVWPDGASTWLLNTSTGLAN